LHRHLGGHVERAREIDPEGDYRLVGGADFTRSQSVGAIWCCRLTFDNKSPRWSSSEDVQRARYLLRPGGAIVSLVSSPDSTRRVGVVPTKDFPEKREGEERRQGQDRHDGPWRIEAPVEDVVWSDDAVSRGLPPRGNARIGREARTARSARRTALRSG